MLKIMFVLTCVFASFAVSAMKKGKQEDLDQYRKNEKLLLECFEACCYMNGGGSDETKACFELTKSCVASKPVRFLDSCHNYWRNVYPQYAKNVPKISNSEKKSGSTKSAEFYNRKYFDTSVYDDRWPASLTLCDNTEDSHVSACDLPIHSTAHSFRKAFDKTTENRGTLIAANALSIANKRGSNSTEDLRRPFTGFDNNLKNPKIDWSSLPVYTIPMEAKITFLRPIVGDTAKSRKKHPILFSQSSDPGFVSGESFYTSKPTRTRSYSSPNAAGTISKIKKENPVFSSTLNVLAPIWVPKSSFPAPASTHSIHFSAAPTNMLAAEHGINLQGKTVTSDSSPQLGEHRSLMGQYSDPANVLDAPKATNLKSSQFSTPSSSLATNGSSVTTAAEETSGPFSPSTLSIFASGSHAKNPEEPILQIFDPKFRTSATGSKRGQQGTDFSQHLIHALSKKNSN